MDKFERQLAGLKQVLVDLDGDGVPDGVMPPFDASPMPRHLQNQTMDPMTPDQMEASRRAVADARFQQDGPAVANTIGQGAFEMTGIPMMQRGANDVMEASNSGNPMQMVRGAGTAALGAMPWARAGRAAMGAAPMTTMGAYLGIPNLDVSAPSANAAEATPPLPTQRNAMLRAAEPSEPSADPANQSWGNKFLGQVRNNANNVVNYLSSAATEGYNALTASGEFEQPTFEEWAAKNGQTAIHAIEKAEQASRQDIPGVNSRTADEIRKRAAEEATKLRQGLQSSYEADVARQRTEFGEFQNKRFSERYPTLNTLGTYGPAVAASARYRGALGRYNKDITGRTNKLMDAARPSMASKNELAGMLGQRPSMMPYLGAGVAGSTLGKATGDFVDMTTLPPDSEARKKAQMSYYPVDDQGNWDFSEMRGAAAGYGARGVIVGSMLGATPLTKRSLSAGELASARTAAGLPNVAAAKLRAKDAAAMQKIPKPAKKISHDQDSPHSQQSGSSQQSTSQTKPSGQGTSSQTNQSGRPNPNQASSQGGSGNGGSSQRLSPKSKLSIRDTLAENNGNITAKQIKELAPNAKPEKVQEYLRSQKLIFKALGPEGYKKAAPYLAGATGAVSVNAMLRNREE